MRAIVLALCALLLLAGPAQGLVFLNAPPRADFVWTAGPLFAHDEVTFVSRSIDDLAIVLHAWQIPGEEERVGLDDSTTHAFARRGEYPVTLTVTDATLGQAHVTRTVWIENSPPVPDFTVDPSPVYRGSMIALSGAATDADGDDIVSWTWDLGDGGAASGRNVTQRFSSLGQYTVTLTVVDAGLAETSVSRPVHVLNAPPLVAAQFAPHHPVAGEVVAFDATGVDPDSPNGALTFHWDFSDGVVIEGPHASRVFDAGNHTAVVRAKDADGGVSAPLALTLRVEAALPP